MSEALRGLIDTLEQDFSLLEPHRLRQREDALDRLDACFPDELGGEAGDLEHRAGVLRMRLEAVNRQLWQGIRQKIRKGAGRDALLSWWPDGRDKPVRLDGEGYDYLDELVAGVMQFEQPGEAIAELAAEMVFYQPTPARHVFDLIERIGLGERDVLIDLGSGLGHVPLLAAVCTTACCIGIEQEAVYVDAARRSAESLNLGKASFIRQDAREADLSVGTVFYLYTPFTGTILRSVLDTLQREAAGRAIRICSYGPCTSVIAEERWLESDEAPGADRIAIFRSR